MHRRSFIFGMSTLAISQMLVGCNASNQPKLTVQVLKGSIPGRILNQFRDSLSEKTELKFSPVVHLQELFQQLQKLYQFQKDQESGEKSDGFDFFGLFGKSQPTKTDLVTLGDFWLKDAIEKDYIQSFSAEKLKNWDKLAPKWQELVKRNAQGLIDKQGKIWAAPYRWGNTVIIYRNDKIKESNLKLKDWEDLWSEELEGKISLLNQPREVIGLTLKKLGKSYNTSNLKEVPSLEKELQELNKQVKFYSSKNYIEPLILGDTWLAVGWSNDVVSILSRYPQLSVVIPESGTALWADLWVQPKAKGVQKDLSEKWIDFCWDEKTAKQIALLTKANSPISELDKSDIPKNLQNLLSANREVFDKSEFLLPLSKDANEQYNSFFKQMKMS